MTWNEFKLKHPKGSIVVGCVTNRYDSGFFVDLGDGIKGFVDILNFRDTPIVNSVNDFPESQSKVDAVVLGFRDSLEQVGLGTRDSDFESA